AMAGPVVVSVGLPLQMLLFMCSGGVGQGIYWLNPPPITNYSRNAGTCHQNRYDQ
ncbi:hypothetical protein L195_g060567, partial [Trifolium pratense]